HISIPYRQAVEVTHRTGLPAADTDRACLPVQCLTMFHTFVRDVFTREYVLEYPYMCNYSNGNLDEWHKSGNPSNMEVYIEVRQRGRSQTLESWTLQERNESM